MDGESSRRRWRHCSCPSHSRHAPPLPPAPHSNPSNGRAIDACVREVSGLLRAVGMDEEGTVSLRDLQSHLKHGGRRQRGPGGGGSSGGGRRSPARARHCTAVPPPPTIRPHPFAFRITRSLGVRGQGTGGARLVAAVSRVVVCRRRCCASVGRYARRRALRAARTRAHLQPLVPLPPLPAHQGRREAERGREKSRLVFAVSPGHDRFVRGWVCTAGTVTTGALTMAEFASGIRGAAPQAGVSDAAAPPLQSSRRRALPPPPF